MAEQLEQSAKTLKTENAKDLAQGKKMGWMRRC